MSWKEVLLPGDSLMGKLALRNGEMAVLFRREVPLGEEESAFIDKHKGGNWIDYPKHRPELIEASLFTAGTDDAGHPYILEVPFGWENVRGPQERLQGTRTP